jgi:hypothetical protein
MSEHPSSGMYSIKLVHPAHLEHRFFLPDTGHDGRPRLMNFSDQGRTPAIAASISPGHRSIVYVTGLQKFVWAIEYTGTVQDGQLAAATYPVPSNIMAPEYCRIFLPIRFLATIDIEAAPAAQVVLQQARVDFTPNVFPMKRISAEEYNRLFDAIDWDWRAELQASVAG